MTSGWRDALQQGLGTTYHIRQELGGGGMSATYVAEETALGRNVVLKVLSPDLAVGLNVERFEHEIRIAARLQHAFIVPVLAAGVSGGQPWYTMPLVAGESLRARITREGALTPSATARIMRDVCEALACAHSQGVVHRDIKPDNILLSGAHAMVTDFGVAKALSASTAGAGLVTGVGMAIGTPAYMAPEQAAGDPATDHRADLYALGATAYEMLAGRPLFGTRSPAQLLVAHAAERPDSLAQVAPAVPPDLAALVDQLLAKHPNDRPARAQDVADALAAMLTRWTSVEIAPPARITIGRAFAFWSAAFIGVVGGAWLAVRWLPIPAWTVPAAVVVMLAGLPVLALTAWLHRSARPISPVPTVASTTTVGRIEAIARPHFTWARASRGGAAAVVALIVLVALWAGLRALGIGPAATLRTQGRITANDRVFVADFDPPPTDTSLGHVVAELLRTDIAISQSIRLVDDNDRQNTLVAMGRPISMRVGSELAREFSQRANAKAYLRGSVTALGTSYLLRAVLVETSTGSELGAFTQSARSADDVIHAVDRMGRDVRDRLGASLREIRSSPELGFAVTPSLEAARLYTDAVHASGDDQPAAISFLERAVTVDTEFAMAYRGLASFYSNGSNLERAAWAAASAFRFRAKLPAAVQRLVEGTYYSMPAAYDLDKSIAAYEALELSPRYSGGLNNLGLAYSSKRDFERSLAVYRQTRKVDSTNSFVAMNMVRPMWATGRKNEAREYVQGFLSRGGLSPFNASLLHAMLAAAELEPDSAEAVLENALRTMPQLTPSQRSDVYFRLADAQRERGRLARSLRSLAEVSNLTPAADTARGIASTALRRGGVIAWDEEQPHEAHRLLDSLAAKHPPDRATALGYPWTELATAYAQAGDAARARELLALYEQRANANMKTRARQDLELARGWTAVADRRYADAVTAFRAADVGACTICALAPLAHAYDLAGQPDSAIAVFERYVSTNQFPRIADAAYLAGTYRRLGDLYERKGDTAKAEAYYSRFVDLWKDADPELQPKVAQVRQRLAALHGRG